MEPDRTTLQFSTNLAALRGIAAMMVVFFHALLVFRMGEFDDPHRQALDAVVGPWEALKIALLAATNGHAAVIIFFVLSGVVLTLSYERQRGAGVARLTAYYIKRGARLWPLLAATAIFAFLLRSFVLEWHDPAEFTTWVNGYLAADPSRYTLLRNILGLEASLNFPAWTIYVEIAASVLFPLLFIVSRNRGLTIIALVGSFAVTATGWNFLGFGQYMVCFVAGAALTRYGAPLADAFLAWPKGVRVGCLVGTWLTILCFERIVSPSTHMYPLTVLVFTLGATVIVGHLYFSASIAVLAAQPLQFLGEMSYGLYLLHFPVLIALSQLGAPLVQPLLALGPGGVLTANLLLGVATLAVTLPLAVLSYRVLESPCQRLGRALAEYVAAFSPIDHQTVVDPIGVRSRGPAE